MMHLGLIFSKRTAFAPVNWPLVNLPWTFFFLQGEGLGLTSTICPRVMLEFEMNALHTRRESTNYCRSCDIVGGCRPVVTRVSIIGLPKIANGSIFFLSDKFAEQREFWSRRELNRKLAGKDPWESVYALELTSNAECCYCMVFFALQRYPNGLRGRGQLGLSHVCFQAPTL